MNQVVGRRFGSLRYEYELEIRQDAVEIRRVPRWVAVVFWARDLVCRASRHRRCQTWMHGAFDFVDRHTTVVWSAYRAGR